MTQTTRADASAYHRRSARRRLRADLRHTWVLVREFREGLLFFVVVLLAGSLSFRFLWNLDPPTGERMRLIESLFHTTTMIFLQPSIDFPRQWYLDLYFFAMPILGLVALARGLSDFAALLFNRRSRQYEWEEAVASTFSNHIVIIGLGHLGIRVVRELVLLDEDIVVVELKPDSSRFDEVHGYDIPIIVGDARSPDVLLRAGIDRAGAVIIATNDDLVNLQVASRIREMSPTVRLVMRMFDDQFAESMSDRFGISAVMSASMMAAPAFAGAAAGAEIIQTFKVADRVLVMGRIEVSAGARLDGCTIAGIEHELDVSVVLHQTQGEVDVRPGPDVTLHAGDVIAVVAALPQIRELARAWNRGSPR